jgi:hypothetical protein
LIGGTEATVMKQKPNSRRRSNSNKSILRLPDLEHANAAVLNSLKRSGRKAGLTKGLTLHSCTYPESLGACAHPSRLLRGDPEKPAQLIALKNYFLEGGFLLAI